jgi:SNF2 family DNA or RNA helicase
MIRNRRDQVSVQLPPRRAATFRLDLSPAERGLYQAVTNYVRDEYQRGEGAPHLKLTLATLQKEVVSSSQAVGRTLAKMAANPNQSDPVRVRLSQLADLAAAVERNCKADAVLDILERYPGKLLIFTDYRATQEQLVAELKTAGHAAVSFHGGLSALGKEEAVRAFRRQARVMVSTESGAEGRNLQFCYQMVNYDLPWNPMRIEQRIGRIHRLGQQTEVFIFNLAARDTVEEVVLDLLERKIRMFELVIGELDLILGTIEERRSFESLLRDAWLSSLDDAELAQKLAELEGLIDQARQDYEQIRSTSDMLSDVLTEIDERAEFI